MGEKVRRNVLDHVSPALRAEIGLRGLAESVTVYSKALRTVRRQGCTEYLPKIKGYKETLFDHVTDMLDKWHGDIKPTFPHMAAELPNREVEIIIKTHDAGEIIVGDAPGVGPERYTPRWIAAKAQEAAAAINDIFGRIEDSSIREEICRLYLRYERKDPHDRVAQFVNAFDKAHGNRVMLENRLDPRMFDMKRPNARMYAHARESAEKFFKAALNFHDSLRTQDGRDEAREWASREFDRFKVHGYGKIASQNKEQFLRATIFNIDGTLKPIVPKAAMAT